MRIAALDFGSNTFLCLIADVKEDGHISILKDLSEVVRLGQGVAQTGLFSDEALVRAELCLMKFSDEIKRLNPDHVLGVATAAARSVSNSEKLVQLCAKFNIPIQIISGEKEAELTFSGALSGLDKNTLLNGSYAVIDIGGGSTEIIVGNANKLNFKKSFNIGVVKLKEKFVSKFPISIDIQNQIQAEIKSTFSELLGLNFENKLKIIAVAGTPTSLASAVLGQYNPQKIDGFTFDIPQLKEWSTRLSGLTPELIENTYFIQKGRSDVLAVGVLILIGALEALHHQQLHVSTRGIRFGLLMKISEGIFNYE